MKSIVHAPWPPCPAPFNLAAHVLAAGAATPDRLALAVVRPTGAERWSYARLIAAVRGCGTGLLAEGLQPGDRILLRLGNTPRFPVAYLGALAAGLVPVVTFAAATAAEVSRMAAAVAPRAVLAETGLALPDPCPPVIDAARLGEWEGLAPCAYEMGAPDRPGYVVFTSGSSGRPTPVLHAHRAIWARGMMHRHWEGLTPADRMLHAGAFNWTYTLGTGLLDPWTLGASALVAGEGVTPEQLALLARRFDATILAAVPGIYRRMLRAGLPPLPRLRHALSAGERLDPALRAAWQAATGTDLHEALGMSEVSTYLSGAPDRPAPMGTAGYPQPGRRVAILDDSLTPVPRGTPGQLAVGAEDPGLALTYPGQEDRFATRLHAGWFLTGDLAQMAEDGAITTLGRADDLMNAGGFRVAPAEVEGAMAALPGLTECAVCAVATPSGAEIIAALYAGEADPADLAAGAAQLLSPYKCPRHWQRIDHLPRSANGKIDRKALPGLVVL